MKAKYNRKSMFSSSVSSHSRPAWVSTSTAMIERTTAGTLNIGSEDLAKWDFLGTFSELSLNGAQQ
jgi:hypothetical protein